MHGGSTGQSSVEINCWPEQENSRIDPQLKVIWHLHMISVTLGTGFSGNQISILGQMYPESRKPCPDAHQKRHLED